MEPAADAQPLLEWLTDKYKDFGAKLEFITDKSQEGSQFVKGKLQRFSFGRKKSKIHLLRLGFGGIGGILRFKVDFDQIAEAIDGDDDDEFYDE